MKYMKENRWLLGICLATAMLVGVAWFSSAKAADLGGDCCADLEERIAELEATTATRHRPGVSVLVYGRVSEAIVWTDDDDGEGDWSVGSNSNAPGHLGIKGVAKVSPGVTAKYVLEIGINGYEEGLAGYGHFEGDTHGIYLRRSYLALDSAAMGTLTIGKASQATDSISQIDLSNSKVASTPLTFRPLLGDGIGEVTEIFDGTRANVIRYDSPNLNGFWLSGSVAAANTDLAGTTDGNVWDVSARYFKELGDWRVGAGVGYRRGIWIEDDAIFGVPISLAVEDEPTVYSGSASVLHTKSGLFGNASYGNMEAFGVDVTGYAFKVGIEMPGTTSESSGKGMDMATGLGSTTFYVEYGKWDISDLTTSDLDYWGAGLVQGFGPMDVYISGRQYDLFGSDVLAVMGGMSMEF